MTSATDPSQRSKEALNHLRHWLFWQTGRQFQQHPDRAVLVIFIGIISTSLLALLVACVMSLPKQLKYVLLTTPVATSAAWCWYEKRPQTKELRVIRKHQRKVSNLVLAAEMDRREKAEALNQAVQGNVLEDQVITAIADPQQRVQYAMAAEVERGIPVAGMGAMLDSDPQTAEVEKEKPITTTVTISPVERKAHRPVTPLEQWISKMGQYIANSGGKGTLPAHWLGEARTRSGKSVIFEGLLNARMRDAIRRGYRVIPLVLSYHGLDQEETMAVNWCGLPILEGMPEEIQPGVVISQRPVDFLKVIALAYEIHQGRMYNNEFWKSGKSQTPFILIIVDEVQRYTNPIQAKMPQAVIDYGEMLDDILTGSSKYGVAFHAIGQDFVARDNKGDRKFFHPGNLDQCIHLMGIGVMDRRNSAGDANAKQAKATMKQLQLAQKPTGLYSHITGWIQPPPMRSNRDFLIRWQVDKHEIFMQRISLINAMRETFKTFKHGADPATCDDEFLILIAKQCSNFVEAELRPWLAEIREFLAMTDEQYSCRHSELLAINEKASSIES